MNCPDPKYKPEDLLRDPNIPKWARIMIRRLWAEYQFRPGSAMQWLNRIHGAFLCFDRERREQCDTTDSPSSSA